MSNGASSDRARPEVYVETSVISDLAARPSGDPVTRGHQESTRRWWIHRGRWDLVTSTSVVTEMGRGDHSYAVRRLEYLAGITLLAIPPAARRLASLLATDVPLPAKARVDADHIATAAVYGVDFLVTWNLKHIANPRLTQRIEHICRTEGYEVPVFCTPEQLLASDEDVRGSNR